MDSKIDNYSFHTSGFKRRISAARKLFLKLNKVYSYESSVELVCHLSSRVKVSISNTIPINLHFLTSCMVKKKKKN